MKRGDIVIAVASGDYGKPRPFVIVQSDRLSDVESVILCPVTSDLRDLAFRLRLEPGPGNGLRVVSEVMIDKVMSIHRDRVTKVIGQVGAEVMSQLDNRLAAVLGLRG